MRTFDEFTEAFDYCRAAGRPVTVQVRGETWKLYPSGRAEQKTGYFKTEGGGCTLVEVRGERLSAFPHRVRLAIKCDLPGDHPHARAEDSRTLAARPDMSDPGETE